jgi:hypothetical protein
MDIAAQHDRILGAVPVHQIDDALAGGEVARPAVGPDVRLRLHRLELTVGA